MSRWATLVVAAVLMASCSSASPSKPVSTAGSRVGARSGSAVELVSAGPAVSSPAPSSSETTAVAQGEQQLALDLLRQAPSSATTTVSPLSLDVTLAMLENGAAGETRSQIASLLHTSALSPAGQDQGWSGLLSSLSSPDYTLHSADAVWEQKGLPVTPAFLSFLAQYFGSGVWQVDFAHDTTGASQAIDQWVSQQTQGRIPQLFDPGQLTSETALVLANAVYFDASWASPFDPAQSHARPFYDAGGPATSPVFMSEDAQLSSVGSGYEAVDLPYAGGKLSAVIVMPTAQPLPAFVRSLTPASLSQIVAGIRDPVTVELPRFTTTSDLDLDQMLQSLGLTDAFDSKADFSALSPTRLQVQSVVQRDYLAVGEKGTEAAAATGVSLEPTAISPVYARTLIIDHPFLFLVRDDATGTVLFASLVESLPSS